MILKIKCRQCGVTKARIRQRKQSFVDLEGKSWKGSTCPSCALSNRAKKKKKVPTVTVTRDEVYITDELLTTRKCRKCKDFLTVSRYFNCSKCTPTLPSDGWDDFIYQSSHCQASVDIEEIPVA